VGKEERGGIGVEEREMLEWGVGRGVVEGGQRRSRGLLRARGLERGGA
jgi:hypothetical protein